MDDSTAAETYDSMINWDERLSREIPVITTFLDNAEQVLDVACSSGRHSLALAEQGFQTVGVDISEPFIELANQLARTQDKVEQCQFLQLDASTEQMLDHLTGAYFDGAILLGNAIANMGSYEAGQTLLRNIFILLRPGGKFFVQTINRPEKPWYNPLRQKDGLIIQRIMVPEDGEEHNIALHVNQIDPETMEYEKQKADNQFFMYTHDEFSELVEQVGFEVQSVNSGYTSDPVRHEDGETLIWKLVKPEIELYPEGIALFDQYASIEPDVIKARTLEIWQTIIRENWYHCIRGYRFLYPRITAHPRYEELIASYNDQPVLDIACNTGTDLRQLHCDGFEELHGIDISSTFIEMGYQLFDDHETCPITFTIADVLDDEFLDIDNGEIRGEFGKFQEYFGLIHSGSLLHLLEQGDIRTLVERVRYLLSDGGVFFGRTVGRTTPGIGRGGLRYLHNIESLSNLLDQVGYTEVDVFAMPRKGPIGESTNDTVLQIGFYAKK